jgi:selenocysteine lyase/cysteine desulfurase
VQALDCDFLVCSVYKFYGPHLGVAWGRYDLLDALPAFKLRPADNTPPDKFELGTGNFEAMAGTTAAINYLAGVGDEFGAAFESEYQAAGFSDRRLALKKAMRTIAAYEQSLFTRLIDGLSQINGVRLYGITDPAQFNQRTPTLAFTKAGVPTAAIGKALGDNNIFIWDGHYYAIEVVQRLGLYDSGGMVRVGISHYNVPDDIDRLLEVVKAI